MTEEKKAVVIKKYKKALPSHKFDSFERSLGDASDDVYEKLMAIPMRDKKKTILFAGLLGWAGVNRFYINDIPFGILKILLTALAVFCFISGNLSDIIVSGIVCLIYVVDIFWSCNKGMEINYDEIMSFMREERAKENKADKN